MISVRQAQSGDDFETAARFLIEFGRWDAAQAREFGAPPDVVMELFHADIRQRLAETYIGSDGLGFGQGVQRNVGGIARQP